MKNIVLLLLMNISILCPLAAQMSWTADNGNGTFTNPLFYDEFSDPDIIRVGEDFYMAGTTMHCMPGLVVLHSKDLVNWKFLSYAFNRLDMGDEFRLANGKEADVYKRQTYRFPIRRNYILCQLLRTQMFLT